MTPSDRSGPGPAPQMPVGAGKRPHDIVIYGASGFVGRLLAQYLAGAAAPEVRIALAGRNRSRLEDVRRGLGARAARWPLVIADAHDEDALAQIASSTSVVATTVGPYLRHGLPLVAACAAAGTHYADLTGEAVFVRRSIDAFDALARRTGARIVHSCGFDSIPSDLGVYLTWQHAESAGLGTLGTTTLVVVKAKGGFSGGTIDSLRNQLDLAQQDRSVARLLLDPFALNERSGDVPPVPPDSVDADVRAPSRDARLGQWVGPFVMAPFNTRVVRRSDSLLDNAYGPDFHYQEVVGFGNSAIAPVLAVGMTAGLAGLLRGLRFGPTRAVLDRVLPSPGEGPDQKTREGGMFVVDIVADTTSGTRLRTRVAADGDPGYAATSMMLGESSLALLLGGTQLPVRAGVLTPAVAMGDVLASRLRQAGMTLQTAQIAP